MADGTFGFDRFELDCADRRLTCEGRRVELSGRYLDALMLLVSLPGRLVTKDQFLGEVWRGIPVTDEALTQCIRTLRRELGDDAANPRLIETVPKHGYRFVAEVTALGAARPSPAAHGASVWTPALRLAAAGTLGGGAAGLVGGLFYGSVAASQPPDGGAISVLLVLVCVTVAVALIGAAAVSFGIVAARVFAGGPGGWDVLGGAAGGLVIGAVVKLIGLDTFGLLFGHVPRGMTGAPEGLLLGAAVGLGAWATSRWPHRSGIALAGAAGAAAGVFAVLIGGRLMGGSLALVSADFPNSRLSLQGVGGLVGEPEFGPLTTLLSAAAEGMLFAAGIATAMLMAERRR